MRWRHRYPVGVDSGGLPTLECSALGQRWQTYFDRPTYSEVAPDLHAIRGGAYNNLEAGRTGGFDFAVGDGSFSFSNTGFRCCHYQFP